MSHLLTYSPLKTFPCVVSYSLGLSVIYPKKPNEINENSLTETTNSLGHKMVLSVSRSTTFKNTQKHSKNTKTCFCVFFPVKYQKFPQFPKFPPFRQEHTCPLQVLFVPETD